MRLSYLLPPVLGLLLVGCGPDEDREREPTPPPATTEQPAAPSTNTTNAAATAQPAALWYTLNIRCRVRLLAKKAQTMACHTCCAE